MRYTILYFCLIGLISSVFLGHQKGYAQPAKTIALSTSEGALNGAILGAGIMAFANDGDVDPLRISVGAGALYGAASGIYDVATIGPDHTTRYGWLTDGRYSTTIVLKDTFYGGVIGTLLGSAIVLISGNDFTDGLRKGVGAGVWTGFGFGLVDAFLLSGSGGYSSTHYQQPYAVAASPAPAGQKKAVGLITYQPVSSLSFGTISPQFYKRSLNTDNIEVGIRALSVAWNF